MRHVISLCIALLLTSCAATSSTYYANSIQSWRGAPVAELLNRYGQPDIKYPDQKGNTLYIYKIQTYRNATLPTSPQIGVNVAGGRPVIVDTPNTNFAAMRSTTLVLSCLTTFIVNPAGQIIAVRTEGNACLSRARFATRQDQSSVAVAR